MAIEIQGRKIGKGHPPFIIAELSANHNGDLDRALKLVEVAKESGADAIKLQTYRADTITIECDKEDFKIKEGPWAGRTLFELYDEAHTPWEWHQAIFDKARALGLIVFSSPFDYSAVDFLEGLDVPAYKVASFELLDLPLIQKMARTQKPIIMSTGMANLSDIAKAVEAVEQTGNNQIILLHCVSSYPASPKEANVKTIAHLSEAFGLPTGLSDHTLGVGVACAAVALGACVIEKHFTLSRAEGGVDSGFSLEPDELKELVETTRQAYDAVGSVSFKVSAGESSNKNFRRSLYIVENVQKGDLLNAQNVKSIRPGFGLAPEFLDEVLGKVACCDLEKGTALKWGHFKEQDL